MKHHPYFAKLLSGNSTRIAYGARTLNEGGLQSIPKLHFPGGALVGCAAGFVNVAKIKGTHNAMKSGMLAAETAFSKIHPKEASSSQDVDMSDYEKSLRESWIWSDLKEVRNLRPSFNTRLGLWGGIAYSGIDSLVLKGRTPWTFHHPKASDAAHTKPAKQFKPIDYPPPQAPLSTDLLTSVALTGTNHGEDQPIHLQISDAKRGEHVHVNVAEYAGLLGRACPAAVYEYVEDEDGSAEAIGQGWDGKKLVINSQV